MRDIYADDDKHPLPKLGVIDITAAKKSGGVDLVLVIASPLDGEEISQKRLIRKVETYLYFAESAEHKATYGAPTPNKTRLLVKVPKTSDPEIFELLENCKPWALENDVSLIVERT